jgi:uncharacterized YccA/Bax inhibitor family protein
MANPMLNDKTIEESRAGWAAPTAPSPGGQMWPAPVPGQAAGAPPLSDGPASPWKGAMTVRGTVNAAFVLLALLLVSATAGWRATEEQVATDLLGNPLVDENGDVIRVAQFPAIAMIGIVVGIACVIGLYFKPQLAKILGPIYALGYGFAVGAISKGYETFQNGIVLQAAGATIAVFFVMLLLYRTGVIKVTNKFRRAVIMATLGIMVFYLVSIVASLFGGEVPFINEPSLLGIGISVVICIVAALNLALDFDFIEKGSQAGLAKDFQWYAAFGLLVTIVWLYLEMLRLLSKLQSR